MGSIPFTPEPILGGKIIDLYRIYQDVQANGGYEAVNSAKNWKLMGMEREIYI